MEDGGRRKQYVYVYLGMYMYNLCICIYVWWGKGGNKLLVLFIVVCESQSAVVCVNHDSLRASSCKSVSY
jgi:hypothetical protein